MKATREDFQELNDMLKKLLRNFERMEQQLAEIRLHLAAREPSPWMTVEEAAAYCGYSKSAFYNRYKEEIPYHQRDTRMMFHVDDLEAWMKKNVKTPKLWQ